MKGGICLMLILLVSRAGAFAQPSSLEQHDSPQTLQWVERQSLRMDSVLNDALLGSEPIEILVKLTDCYQLFDAISMAGLYCTEVRAAAEAGRNYCDVINYRLEKDLNSKVQRVVNARKQAIRMREGAKACSQIPIGSETPKTFSPNDLVIYEAHMAELDLLDGMASENMHILSQKVELAIRTLYELEHLARSLDNCENTLASAEQAVISCQKALTAPNWMEVKLAINAALAYVQGIQQSANCVP